MEWYKYESYTDGLIDRPPTKGGCYDAAPRPWQGFEQQEDISSQAEPAETETASHQECQTTVQTPLPHDKSALTTTAILAKIRAPYDWQEKRLARMQKRICAVPPPTRTYATSFGIFTFPELYEQTRKYAAYALHHTYQTEWMDIEDGLQAGYMWLWQRLQEDPLLLRDKAMVWVAKGIIYKALHATRGDWRFRQQTRGDGDLGLEQTPHSTKVMFRAHSPESRHSDIRLDLHDAIESVARRILREGKGKQVNYELWALYGVAMLATSASETSQMFTVRKQTMQAAYKRVRGWLQEALPSYMPLGETVAYRKHGREALPEEDMRAIRKGNREAGEAVYEAVKRVIESTNADTRRQDELALAGIREGIPMQTQARRNGLPGYTMQRAYKRVHLMIGAQQDPEVRVLRPERRVKHVFTLSPRSAAAVEQLAQKLLEQPRSYEKLVALHAHIHNFAISTTAKHFNIPTSTLRYYVQQIAAQLETPVQPAREG